VWRAAGVVVMFGLFLGISIPMIEKRHLERKGEKYAAYQRRVPMLIPGLKTKRT
jgi:protein-S-isoprenylcysteine O-methyltransferase Ste14